MKNLICNGLFKMTHGCSDVYCDPMTGDIILNDDINGSCIISTVSVIEPKVITEHAMLRLISSFSKEGVIGVVTTDKYLITFTEDKAQYRLWTSPTVVTFETVYDTDVVYEEDIDS